MVERDRATLDESSGLGLANVVEKSRQPDHQVRGALEAALKCNRLLQHDQRMLVHIFVAMVLVPLKNQRRQLGEHLCCQPGLDQKPAIGNTLQLGFLNPDQIYIGLDERDADPQGLIRDATRGGTADGESQLGGEPWQRFVSDDDRTRALVRSGPDSTPKPSAR